MFRDNSELVETFKNGDIFKSIFILYVMLTYSLFYKLNSLSIYL